MQPIGGYFSIELPKREEYHKYAIRLNTGRNCLEYILRVRKYNKVYIPYYTCEVILEPFKKTRTPYEFYHINIQLELSQEIHLNQGEALLYTNYFGLKQRYMENLAEKYQSHLIIDNTQAFYAKPISGIDTFYTCRKFFGVSDGAYLYCDTKLDEDFELDRSCDRMTHLLKRIDFSAEEGYADFRRADEGLNGQPIKHMSKLTHHIMQSIDYETIAQRRRFNYQLFHAVLGNDNDIELPLENDAVPMVYPYMIMAKGLREKLIENRIYVARYWPNVLEWSATDDIDYLIASQMQPLPIDQRYRKKEIYYIIETIQKKNECISER